MRLWNYAVKVADLDAAADFYAETMDGEERLAGRVFGCDYRVLLLFTKAPYEDLLDEPLSLGFLHMVFEVDDFDTEVARLRDAGVPFILEPQEVESEFGRRRIVFFVAPDGVARRSCRSSATPASPERTIDRSTETLEQKGHSDGALQPACVAHTCGRRQGARLRRMRDPARPRARHHARSAGGNFARLSPSSRPCRGRALPGGAERRFDGGTVCRVKPRVGFCGGRERLTCGAL